MTLPTPDAQHPPSAASGGAATSQELLDLAPAVYDFALRVTLDAGGAAAVTEAAMLRAFHQPQAFNLSLRASVFAFARDEALNLVRDRSRPEAAKTGEERLPAADQCFSAVDPGSDPAMAAWAWLAARSQRPRDYCLLDLSLRRSLRPEEIAVIASLTRSGVHAVAGRLRSALEESFLATALFHLGGEHCRDLAALLTTAPPGLSPALRREIGRHAESCDACQERARGWPSAAELLASLRLVPAPAGLQEGLARLLHSAGQEQAEPTAAVLLDLSEAQPVELPTSAPAAETAIREEQAPVSEPDWGDGRPSADSATAAEGATEGPDARTEPALPPAETRLARAAPFPGVVVPPPRPPARRRSVFGRGWRRNLLLAGAGAGFAAVVYLGVALGDSLSTGGSPRGPVLPTAVPGLPQLVCGAQPVSITQGSRAALVFGESSQAALQVASVSVQPISSGARGEFVNAYGQQGRSVVFEARPRPGSLQVDEYRVLTTFSSGSRSSIAQCLVQVQPLPVTPTATRPPVAVTPAATATAPVVAPAATATPTPVPTATATLVPPPTPTQAPEPTATPPPTATPTATATSTRTPAGSPTPSPTPTPTNTVVPRFPTP